MKKLLIIGAIALVVVGCVLAAGCTSNTSTTTSTEDYIVGTWTDGNVNYVFTKDFKGSEIRDGTILGDFTWKKTADGKYEVDASTGVKTIVTLDKNKGTLTTDSGAIITKVLTGTNESIVTQTSRYPEPLYR